MSPFKKHLKKIAILAAILGIMASAIFAAVPTPVFAGVDVGIGDGTTGNSFPPVPTVAPNQKDDVDAILAVERQFEGQKELWLIQAENLAAKVRRYIADRKARGLSTGELESALKNFTAVLMTADDGVAAYTLEHGSVTDKVAQIGRSQRNFRITVRNAQAELLFKFNKVRGNDSGYKK